MIIEKIDVFQAWLYKTLQPLYVFIYLYKLVVVIAILQWAHSWELQVVGDDKKYSR